MSQKTGPRPQSIRRFAALTVAALALAACGGTGGVGDQPEPDATPAGQSVDGQGSPSTITVLTASDETPTAGGDGGSGFDLCAAAPTEHGYLVEIGLLKEEDLAGLPVPDDIRGGGYWPVSPLGPDGAYAVGEELIDGWICDLEVTPEVVRLLGALLEEGGSEITIEEIEAIVRGEPGGDTDSDDGSLDTLSPSDLEQLSRDFLYAAGLAEELGYLDRSNELKDQARDVYSAYGETMVNESTDPKVLMDVAAGAQLLGLDDLADSAAAKISEILEKELSDAATLFNRCTEDPDVIRIYIQALVNARALDQTAGDGRYEAWLDIQERRALDEPVPECEGAIFAVVEPLEGWDGTLDVLLSTCGFTRWTGRLVASGTLAEAGGTMTLNGTIPLDIQFTDQEDQVGVGDFAGTAEVTLTTPDATGEGGTYVSGRAFFTKPGNEWELELFFDADTFNLTITANGVTITQSRPIDWEEKTFTGKAEPFDSACAE
mgnify:FL=1